jgi:sulfate transport system ATP-binding protein
LEIPNNGLVALVGESGSGKSTLLRVLAGLDLPDSGNIWIGGKDCTFLPVQQRNIGYLFQNYALFPHLTVFENIAFGLRVRKVHSSQIEERVWQLLGLIQLDRLADRYPNQISGGQRQRVALARALAIEPRLLILDEPFSAVDFNIRRELRSCLQDLHNQVEITTLFVTHDYQEAVEIAHDVALFHKGTVLKAGSSSDIAHLLMENWASLERSSPYISDVAGLTSEM